MSAQKLSELKPSSRVDVLVTNSNIEATMAFDTPGGAQSSPSAEVGPVDYLEHLDFALMLTGEARIDHVGAFMRGAPPIAR